jgi:aminopeptidase
MIAIKKLANLLVAYCIEAKKNEVVEISANSNALPLVEEVYAEVMQVGAFPRVVLGFEKQKEFFYTYANSSQLKYISPVEITAAETVDKIIHIRSQDNTVIKQFSDKESVRAKAASVLNQKSKHARWVLTLYPTNAYAQEAGMSLLDFETYYENALFLTDDEPAARWAKLGDLQNEFISRFSGAKNIQIIGDGVDIKFSIANRTFVNSDGKQNMPSGEIYTSPLEESVSGIYTSNIPNTKYGSEIDGVRLVFEEGRVIDATATKGEKFLSRLLKRDEGAEYLGEFGIGCNYGMTRYIRNILFDEKIGGSIHLAIGQGYEKAGGKNVSSVHLDLIRDMKSGGEIIADGQVIYRNGVFL